MSVFATWYNTKYNFLDVAPDRDLKKRGFSLDPQEDPFPFYYREDGVRLFNIILEYATNVLNTEFAHGDALLSDDLMQQFLSFCVKDARVPGFPEVKSLQDYARVLATIIWNVSAYHAISFSIEHIDSYIPFRPPCVQAAFPLQPSTTDISFAQVVANLPYPKKCELILVLNNVITLRTVPTLLQLTNPFSGNSALTDVFSTFQKQLSELSELIKIRNAELSSKGQYTYEYLDPAKVEASLSI
jgi:hypothetical protein